MSDSDHLTERQQKWFASVRAGIERDTGRSVEQWAEIARACPETKHNKRLAWLKENHGLGRNSASIILDAAFPPEQGWETPEKLAEALWRDPTAKALFTAIEAKIRKLPDIVAGQRKTYSAFSREYQFAAMRPIKQSLLIGFACDPDLDPRLQPAGKEAWSERLKSKMAVADLSEIDDRLDILLKTAWERS